MLKTLCAVLILIGTCQAGTHANTKALKTDLFTNKSYDYKIRPIDDQSEAMEITVDLHLLAINEVSESAETLKTTAFLNLFWNDAFLKWDKDTTDITVAFWPQEDVWKPDIALKNSNVDYKDLGAPSLNVQNTAEGFVTWMPFHVFESTCTIDITNFPFDYQTCYLKFQAWSYRKSEVIMLGGSNGIEMSEYEPNSGWEVTATGWEIQEDSDDSAISFKLQLKRKPLYFMLSVILPIITLAILNLCVFLLPCTSGEKASYAITVFLSFAVFLTIVSSQLPKNSESVSLISVFLIIQTICSTLITVLALTLLRMSSFDDTVAIPRCLVFFVRYEDSTVPAH
ncbi:acetylcholine receptor subunit beta-like 1 [Dreissena polymorpha]|uniref:acetylcholine receptor subunit beta-like 1 n=1 Tax=Dreissena polymorpha TaxID=45954 RepID=UPI002264D80C|nr:acetylcholine receptor subunit beta-like 1 [Dreissena polymorpha]